MEDPTRSCPYCGDSMEADWVHNGVDLVQCGPFLCSGCGASEIGIGDTLEVTDEERRTGFYRDRVSPAANTFLGRIVNHRDAEALHSAGVLDGDRS